ncbi:MAG: DUF420 domain-containing protein [Planctomycetes bacterium]|nr:DUF420 domain-containing protein [Planctomycetota bacterium]
MNDERAEFLERPADDVRARRLRGVAWGVSAIVLLLVGGMQRIRIELPDGWSTAGLPPIYSALNALCAVTLVVAVICVKRGRLRWHRRAMTVALALSVLFLLGYVAYHVTNDPTRYAGQGPLRTLYLALLATHIVAAAVSFPCILFTFIAAWTNQFQRHRRLAKWVFPLWLYVAVTGPVCYLLLHSASPG